MTNLGNKKVLAENLKKYMDMHNVDRYQLCADLKFKYTTVCEWLAANKYPRIDKIEMMANYFGIQKSDLIEKHTYGYAPTVTADFTTFPVIGEVAAGYDHIAVEDWDGDTVDIPNSYLRGRDPSEYFVLKVIGDSMLPKYEDGDRVLVHRQSSMDHSGQIGVVLYDGNIGTLKKVEYVMGEDWMELVPLNDAFSSVKIKGSALEQCRVLGVPKLLIREIED